MGFILGVLIIGALLSMIFGKKVAAMFVTGTATVVAVIFIVLLVLLSPLIYGFFTAPSHQSPASSYGSYPTASSAPLYSTPSAPVVQAPTETAPATPAYQAAPAPPAATPAYQAPATPLTPPVPSPTPAGPKIGITVVAADPQLSKHFSMDAGLGLVVNTVTPGGPADQAGLRQGDFIQAMDTFPVSSKYALTEYEAHMTSGQRIILSVQHNDGAQWGHKFVKVTPR